MRVPLTPTGLLAFLLFAGCSAKQRDFDSKPAADESTEGFASTGTDPNPESSGVGTTSTGPSESSADPLGSQTSADDSSVAVTSTTPAASDSGAGETESQPGASGSLDTSSDGSEWRPGTSGPETADPPNLWDDLVLHLTMDDAWESGGAVRDGSPAGNHGVANGTVTPTPDGKFGQAASFDGDGWITVPDSESLDGASALTMSAWVNFEYSGGDYSSGVISKRAGFGDRTSYALFFWAESKLWVDIDYETERFSSSSALELNRWYHVAVVYDGAAEGAERVRLYVDGALDSIAYEASTEIPDYGSDLEVGRLVNGGNTMIGMIDEVAVWRRALEVDEIELLSQSPL